ncbi:MAG: GNAT family N-acetyltransferase [Bacteroidales bacterium]|nr:GNAT family N-acetyltransferase [Bacteroidales bacterium]
MNYTIRPAREEDFDRIFELICELARFEQAAGQVSNSPQKMREEQAYFKALVVEKEDGELIGFALYFFAYYTWVGKSLYLDDLYITESYRKHGIGKALLNEINAIARRENCKRIRWQVLDWNTPAIEFYRSLGVSISNEWLNCDS